MTVSSFHRALSSLKAFVFDIDGVLLKGRQLIPGAEIVLQQLYDTSNERPRYPLCFLTNSGGKTEIQKAKELEDLLGVKVRSNQVMCSFGAASDCDVEVVMCHTPMRSLAEKYSQHPVIMAGKGDLIDIGRHYGFQKILTVQQYHAVHPSSSPFSPIPIKEGTCPVRDEGWGTEKEPIRSVMVLTDPIDWARDLQILTDVVASDGVPHRRPSGNGNQLVDVYIAHNDLLWANEFPSPRYGLGAFSLAFRSLYRAYTDRDLIVTHFGKPTPIPFKLAEKLLMEQVEEMGHRRQPDEIYMIGDNPAADVRGARNAGHPWRSVLVRTGVFQSEADNSVTDPADIVADDVLSFLREMLERE